MAMGARFMDPRSSLSRHLLELNGSHVCIIIYTEVERIYTMQNNHVYSYMKKGVDMCRGYVV